MTFAERALSSLLIRICGFIWKENSLGWLCSFYCIACIALKEIGTMISQGFKSLPASLNKNISNIHL